MTDFAALAEDALLRLSTFVAAPTPSTTVDVSDDVALADTSDAPSHSTRPYQEALYHCALERNTVVVMPTGSGKTFVAVLVARRLLSDNGQSRAFVVVPTQTLAEQQGIYFRRHARLRTAIVHGGHGVDDWLPGQWSSAMRDARVVVFTYATLLQGLEHVMLTMEHVALLVVDECHHATAGDHPLARLMHYARRAANLRILGLTASPVVSLGGQSSVHGALRTLEKVMASQLCAFAPGERGHSLVEMRETFVFCPESSQAARDGLVSTVPSGIDRRAMLSAIDVAMSIGSSAARRVLAEADPAADPSDVSLALMGLPKQSSKLCRLLEALKERRMGLCGIIFCQRRVVAVELARVLQAQGYNCTAVVGVNARGGDASSALQVRNTLDAFGRGEYELLVATAVLEEGIDVSGCNLVVAYDGFQTEKAYIQSKGRCRAPQRELVAFLSTDKERKRVAKARQLERSVVEHVAADYTEDVSHVDVESASTDGADEHTYIVAATGARADLCSSVGLVNRLAQTLSAASTAPWFQEHPVDGEGFISHLHLPNDLPSHLRHFASAPHASKNAARRHVCLEAVRALHQAGWLSPHLLPVVMRDVISPTLLKPCDAPPPLVADVVAVHERQTFRVRVDWCDGPSHSVELLLCVPLAHTAGSQLSWSRRMMHPRLGVHMTMRLEGVTSEEDTAQSLRHHFDCSAMSESFDVRVQQCTSGSATSPALWDVPDQPTRIYFVPSPADAVPYSPEVERSIQRYWNSNILANEESDIVRAISLVYPIKAMALVSTPTGKATSTRHERYLASSLGHGSSTRAVDALAFLALPLVPSFVQHLTLRHAAARLCEELQLPLEAHSIDTLAEALTMPSGHLGVSYERLEFVGDAILKALVSRLLFETYDFDEGRLTSAKSMLVSNETLASAFRRGPLAALVSQTAHATSIEGWADFDGRLDPAQMPDKRCADLCEALLGAVWHLTASEEHCQAACRWMGITLPTGPQSSLLHDESPSSSCDVAALDAVYRATGYRFLRPQLLREALTHPSAPGGVRNWQRLEFLGDAILDVACFECALERNGNASPSDLSDFRYAAASTECLALVTLRHGLHHHIEHLSSHLSDSIAAVEELHQALPANVWLVDQPKAFADVAEAVLGAIWLDAHFDWRVALDAAHRMCRPQWAWPNNEPPRNPVRVLRERLAGAAPLAWREGTLHIGPFALVRRQTSVRRAAACALEMLDSNPSLEARLGQVPQ